MIKITKTLALFGVMGGLLLSSAGGASAAIVHYKDVKQTDNYYIAVENLLEQKAISRTLDNFRPNENITRGQAASILAKVLGLDISKVNNPKFKDVSTDNQFYPYIAALANEGIIGGKSDGTFGINEPLKRGQMSAILLNAYDIPVVGIHDIKLQKFKDLYKHKDISSDDMIWYFSLSFSNQFSQQAYTMDYFGFASGYPKEKRFGINVPIKRSQFALMIHKLQKNEGKLSFFPINEYNAGPLTTSFNNKENIVKIEEVTVEDESVISVKSYLTDNDIKEKLYVEGYLNIHHNGDRVLNDYIVFNLHKEGITKVNIPNLKTKLIVHVKEVNGKLVAEYSFEETPVQVPTTSGDTITVTADSADIAK
ncbi:S-layer homology domain-containing protein [Solibacillus silvestris]|uniref:S-layer homology domain-containing protein n=1 Tax=Solibacillus silvestris TaxID=76853 RepID=UPI003F81E3F3